MTCRELTISATNKRKVRASMRRISYRNPDWVLALAFALGVLMTALPLTFG